MTLQDSFRERRTTIRRGLARPFAEALSAGKKVPTKVAPRRSRVWWIGVIVVAMAMGIQHAPFARANANANDTWTQTRTGAYAMGDVGPMLGPVGCRPMGRDGAVGTVCFGRTVGDTFIVKIRDDSGRKVGGVIQVRNSDGWTVLNQPFCGTSGALRSIPGELTVHLDAPGDVRGTHWFGGPGCTEINPLGASAGTSATGRLVRLTATTRGATSGKVHVTFTRRG